MVTLVRFGLTVSYNKLVIPSGDFSFGFFLQEKLYASGYFLQGAQLGVHFPKVNVCNV